ncbi:hypothetical protein I8748_22120 [Nostoc sp. CENA67]|uniref:Uncharacterized protein n=1 Tax=Amazonocrinis nigriterrae CENA67 TaxID=2794033 RepID=A0A8J7HWM6_9NOST|nr:hypothetical protein [Amazonocrinis nigriterrae]MBH8564845.1 hypothetical protein [Amazonocrinis nigriterrae CENA67]
MGNWELEKEVILPQSPSSPSSPLSPLHPCLLPNWVKNNYKISVQLNIAAIAVPNSDVCI